MLAKISHAIRMKRTVCQKIHQHTNEHLYYFTYMLRKTALAARFLFEIDYEPAIGQKGGTIACLIFQVNVP